jgi:hypothetical protein
VTVLLSDGQHNTGPAPYDIANKLKEVADLLCVAFGEAADLRTLRRLATTPKHCVRCSSGQELRQFFVQVGVTLTQTLGSHSDATIALAQITRSETER